MPDLAGWAASYYPAPAAMLAEPSARSRGRRATGSLNGGRAPGTLAPHPPLGGRRGLPRGDQNVSRSFVVQSQRERILDAVTNLTARDGYAALRVEGIAEEAAVSLVAFYEHFADKEDAFLVAFEVGQGKALAIVESAFVAHSDWRLAVRAGIAALFDFLASEPSFAHLALLDALIATEHTAAALARRRGRVRTDARARHGEHGRAAAAARDDRGDCRRAVRSLPALRARRQNRRPARGDRVGHVHRARALPRRRGGRAHRH